MLNRMHQATALFVSACMCLSAGRAADSITLTSSAVVEGQIVRDTPGDPLVTINTGGKRLLLNRSEIASIALDDEGRAEYARRRDALKDNKAPAHFELYKWAAARHLYDYADRELSATLKADSSHAEARKIAFAPAPPSKPSPAADAPKAPAGAQAPNASGGDEGLVIGVRAATPAARLRSDYDEKIAACCSTLLPASTADENARKAALNTLTTDRLKATESIVALLDPARGTDEQTRLAALAGIDALKPASPDVSKRLAQASISDPYIPVRKQTVALIKSRNDEAAMNSMVNAYVSAFDESGRVRDPILKGAAEVALKGLEDKRVYSSLFYRATMEVRTAVADLNALQTRQIDSYTVNSGANANVVIPLSFPIQFPELKITSLKTTVCAPCAALSSITGQNLGNDLDAWAKWIRMQK